MNEDILMAMKTLSRYKDCFYLSKYKEHYYDGSFKYALCKQVVLDCPQHQGSQPGASRGISAQDHPDRSSEASGSPKKINYSTIHHRIQIPVDGALSVSMTYKTNWAPFPHFSIIWPNKTGFCSRAFNETSSHGNVSLGNI